MNHLSKVLVFKIVGTICLWCLPLLCFPEALLESIGFPPQPNYLFVRLLGWAYLSLCIGYSIALKSSLQGYRMMAPIWVGVVSNGGACVWLSYFGITGTFDSWGNGVQILAWVSIVATALITAGLIAFGVLGKQPTT